LSCQAIQQLLDKELTVGSSTQMLRPQASVRAPTQIT